MMATNVNVISDGVIKLDGGCMFGPVPKVAWEDTVPTDRKNRITLGLNCLLLQSCGKTVLVDTGVGSKDTDNQRESLGLVPSRLIKGLRGMGLTHKDIDIVILTNLNFDHCGGCTRLDRAGNVVPTFPNARYVVQTSCWKEARQPSERCSAHYHNYRSQNFQPMEERGQLERIDGDTQIFPGLNVNVGGLPKGHQIVLFHHGGERIAFLGELVPTPYHLELRAISAFDDSPENTLTQKKQVLAQAEREGWLLVFAHGHETKAGYLERRGHRSYLRPVDLCPSSMC